MIIFPEEEEKNVPQPVLLKPVKKQIENGLDLFYKKNQSTKLDLLFLRDLHVNMEEYLK
jgi:hypothetical protein